MRLRNIVLGLACVGVVAESADARGVRRLQPAGKWVVEYAADTCRLAREFGQDGQRVTVFFEQFVPGDKFTLMFVGRSISAVRDRASVRFGPVESADTENSVTLATVGSLPAIMLGTFQRLAPMTKAELAASKEASRRDEPYELAPISVAREQAATWLELGKVLSFDLVFETGPMDKPLEALRQCSWDTIKSWGLSIEEQKGLTRHATPIVQARTWFNPNDYPAAMLNQGYEGNVNFRVIVDATGAPLSCKIQSSTRPQAFDDVVCGIVMKRARFRPALDAGGKPIKSYWRQSVRFRLGL